MSTSRTHTLPRNLEELLKKYESEIKTLKRIMQSKRVKDIFEDTILIRYILSYENNIEGAAESVEKAINWRKKHIYPLLKHKKSYSQDDDIIYPDRVKPYFSLIQKSLVASKHKCTIDNQPVVIARLKLCNFTFLLDHVPESILIDYIVYSNEHEFLVCNEQTKKSKILCRTFRFIDLKGFMLKTFDRRFLKVFANTSKMSEFLHPQLVGQTYLINAPAYIRVTIETLKTFGISKRTLNKLTIPKIGPNEQPADCDWFSSLVHKEDIPTYLGGHCECETGCIPGFENDLETAMTFNSEEVKKEIKINLEKLKKGSPEKKITAKPK